MVADLEAVASGKPERVGRRARNRAVAKGLGAVGVWRLFRKVFGPW